MKREQAPEKFRYPLITKEKLTKIFIRSLVFTAIAYLFLAPFTINRQATIKVYRGLTEGVTECSFDRHYSAIANFGGGGYQTDDGTNAPNIFSRRRLDTTALLIKKEVSNHAILLDGYQGRGADPNTNRDYLKTEVPQLPDENIYVDSDSTSTATNVDSAKIIIQKKGFGEVAFVTDKFHALRASIILKIKKVNGCIFTVEQVNEKFNSDGMKEITQKNKGNGSLWRRFTEILKTASLLYDPQGQYTSQVERSLIKLLNK